jgi:hypothetical protein
MKATQTQPQENGVKECDESPDIQAVFEEEIKIFTGLTVE